MVFYPPPNSWKVPWILGGIAKDKVMAIAKSSELRWESQCNCTHPIFPSYIHINWQVVEVTENSSICLDNICTSSVIITLICVSGLGVAMLLLSLYSSICYSIIPAWSLYYFVVSICGPELPWAGCDNSFNTEGEVIYLIKWWCAHSIV